MAFAARTVSVIQRSTVNRGLQLLAAMHGTVRRP